MSNNKWTVKLRDDQVITVIACIEFAREGIDKEHLNSSVARRIALKQVDDLLEIFRDLGVAE